MGWDAVTYQFTSARGSIGKRGERLRALAVATIGVLDAKSVALAVASRMAGAESLNSHQSYFMILSRNSLSSRS